MNGKMFQLSFTEKMEAFYSKALVFFVKWMAFVWKSVLVWLVGSQKSETRE